MCRPSRRILESLGALAALMTLLSMTLLPLLFAAPASADTVTPVRDCSRGNDYQHLDGEYSATTVAPPGYLIASYCVDSDGRRGGSEVHILEPPQRTTTVWHSEGRPLRGYSVAYVRASESGQPEPEPEPDESSGSEDDQDESDPPSATRDADEEQSPADGDDRSAAPGPAEQSEPNKPNARTSSAAPEPKPSRKPSAAGPATSESPSQMTALSDGEELTVTSLAEKNTDDDETLRDLVVAGSIIVIGLLAGAVALLVRLPGQR